MPQLPPPRPAMLRSSKSPAPPSQSTPSPLHGLGYPMVVAAGACALASVPFGLPGDFVEMPHSELMATGSFVVDALLSAAGYLFLTFGFAGLADHVGRTGRGLGRTALLLGLAAAVVGFFLEATHAFVQPAIASAAPDMMNAPPGGLLAVGVFGSALLNLVGLVTFGVSALRAKVFPVVAAVLIIVGMLAFVVSSAQSLLLGAGLLWAGVSGLRSRTVAPASAGHDH